MGTLSCRKDGSAVFLKVLFAMVAIALSICGSIQMAEASATRLYITDNNNSSFDIPGDAATTNVPPGNNATGNNASYVTLLSTSAPTNSSTYVRSSYTATTTYTPLVRSYFNTPFDTSATVAANVTGVIIVRNSNSGDRYEFRLYDYNPVAGNGSDGTLINTITNVAGGTNATSLSITFTNAAYTLPQGHYLMLEVLFKPASSGNQGRVYSNSGNLSYINAGIRFTITSSVSGSNGTISPLGAIAVDYNSATSAASFAAGTSTFAITADSTYNVQSLLVDGVSVAAAVGSTSYPYTFTNVKGNHTISVAFTLQMSTFNITPSNGGGIDLGPPYVPFTPYRWAGGSTYTYTSVVGTYPFLIIPNAGYGIEWVRVDGVDQGVPLGQTTPFSLNVNIGVHNTLSAQFQPFYTVTSSAGTGGTIDPLGSTGVLGGQSLTFDITPNVGYRILAVTDNSVNVGNTSPYTITNITSNHAVNVTFQPVFTITASAGPNGTITPIGDVLVDVGGNRTFSMSPNVGYRVYDVLIDGSSVGAMTSYTFANVTDNHTIEVSFVASPLANAYCAIPPFISTPAPANVMLMLSVETPMQGPANPNVTDNGLPKSSFNYVAYTSSSTCSSNGALGCYSNSVAYYGYFDSNKCYSYSGSGSSGLFSPSVAATSHQCGGTAWSGNFLNWMTTIAVDAFRKAFTGGNRDVDTATDTVLLAARLDSNGWFPDTIYVDNAQLYTPYSGTRYFKRENIGIGFAVCASGQTNCTVTTTGSGESQWPVAGTNTDAVFSLRIKACDSTGGVETRCNSTTNKPEGTIQKYMDRMRFALMSYAADNSQTRDGGILREKMKWVGPLVPAGLKYHNASNAVVVCNTAAGCANPEKEVNSDGTFINNPDSAGSGNSGLINYINKFAYTSGYKSYDPAGELYYEVVRYFKNLVPSTSNYCNGLTEPNDNFPVYCNASKTNARGWRDPTLYDCSQNFAVAINDANPWLDKRIPGSAFKAAYHANSSPPAGMTDYCGSSSGACDSDFADSGVQVNVEAWTNLVGDYEGFTGKTFNASSRMFGCEVDASGVCIGGFNSGGKSITVQKLGRIIGTPPGPGKENSYNIAGLAYYAHNTDLRPDLTHTESYPKHNLTTFMIDTQEPASNMLVGPMNMLWLAAKYGGFTDLDGDGKPYNNSSCGGTSASPNAKCSEWDADNDGNPDNYFFASAAAKVESALNYAFEKITSSVSSGTAAAVANNKSGERGANLIQALFFPGWKSDRNIKWLGEVQALWYYLDPVINYSNIYEDTVGDYVLDLTQDQPPGSDPYAVKALWKAGVELHKRSASTRSIYTLLSSSTSDLTNSANAFSTTNRSVLKSFMNVSLLTDTQADTLINYLRGVDTGSYRSRTVSVTSGASTLTSVWKLGDVINSTPQVQSAVALNSYNQTYADSSYTTFIRTNQYKSRNMVYSGANDGMLHAFKLGLTQKVSDASHPFRIAEIDDTTDLGKEEWSFIPYNTLPYLKYTADQGYCHQYLVDGAPVVVDASFSKYTTCTETNYWDCPKQTKLLTSSNNVDTSKTSWNTVLIGSMGLGGASRDGYCNETLSPDTDPANNTDCVVSPISGSGLSSYFALNVTDPLLPRFMWEFSDAILPTADKGLGLTTAGAAVVRINAQSGSPASPDVSKNGHWFAVFASGPTGSIDVASRQFLGRSDQNLKIYVVDLNPFVSTTGFVKGTNYWVFDTGVKFAFANSLAGASIDLDRARSTLDGYYSDDAVYVSYTKATLDSSASPGPYPTAWDKGGVLRLVTKNDPDPANWFVSTLIDDIGPVTTSIGKLQDRNNKKLWVYFGEGRYFFRGDELNTDRRIYGVMDPCYNYDPAHENTLSAVPANCPAVSFGSLKDQTSTPNDSLTTLQKGWYISLDSASGTTGAERVVSDVTASFNGIVFYTTYIPDSDICLSSGKTSLWAVKYSTGGTPPAGGLKGKAPLQTSSGGISLVDLGTAFTQRGGRKLSSSLSPSGMAPKGRFPQLLQPKPVKRILNIQER